MTTRDLKSTIAVGGAIAASLPNSMKRAARELERLKTLQAADEAQAKKLRRELSALGKGTDEYRVKTSNLSDVTERLNLREDKITEAGVAARGAQTGVGGLTGRLQGLGRVAGPVGLTLGAVAGIAASLGAVLLNTSGKARTLLDTVALTGTEAGSLPARRDLPATLHRVRRVCAGWGPVCNRRALQSSPDTFRAATQSRVRAGPLPGRYQHRGGNAA